MKTTFKVFETAIYLLSTSAGMAIAWEKEEHRLVADRALTEVLADCGLAHDDSLVFTFENGLSIRLGRKLWEDKSFGELCESFSKEDISRSRFHERGRTILQQLQSLTSSVIDAAWRERRRTNAAAAGAWPPVRSAEQSNQNVVANYLLHHLIALRFAGIAGEQGSDGKEALRRALIYEAMAQSYLTDAFSAGHLLVPLSDALSSLHPINNKHAHAFYGSEGAFVVNAAGDLWQTFGDKLLLWYAPTYRHVFDACKTSLRELFLSYYVSIKNGIIPEYLGKWAQAVSIGASKKEMVKSWMIAQDGDKYFSTNKMPALLLLPMPISATWSVRTEIMDEHGIHQRKHYPQLRESGFHDPDVAGIDPEFLYPRATVPTSMIPSLLSAQSPRELIKSHPDYASARYVQERNFPPSYVGLLFSAGGGIVFNGNDHRSGTSVSMGYGFVDDLLVLNKLSFEAALMPSFNDARRLLIAPTLGMGIKLPASLKGAEAFRIEGGYAWGLRTPFKAHGAKLTVGFESPTIPLGLTYAGITIRLKYQWLWLERTLRGVLGEIVLH